MDLNHLYRQIVMDHAKNRRNHRELDQYTHKIHYKNPTCGDVMTMYARMNDDRIEALTFIGDGCFISMASSSMFTTIANGKTITEVQALSEKVENMIRNGTKIEDEALEEVMSLENVHQLPARYNCALMPYQAFAKLLRTSSQR